MSLKQSRAYVNVQSTLIAAEATLTRYKATLKFDPNQLGESRLSWSFVPSALELSDDDPAATALLTPLLLSLPNEPVRFRSSSFSLISGSRYLVKGETTYRAKKHKLTFPATLVHKNGSTRFELRYQAPLKVLLGPNQRIPVPDDAVGTAVVNLRFPDCPPASRNEERQPKTNKLAR